MSLNQTQKNLFIVAGIIALILGITGAIPSFLTEQYSLATLSALSVIGGVILIAIGFGD